MRFTIFRRLHKAKAGLAEAEKQLAVSEENLERTRQVVVQPRKHIQDRNHISAIVEAALQKGYR
jgi:hypothetical protein